MYRRSRIRRIAKWAGLAVCVMMMAAWGLSLRWSVGCWTQNIGTYLAAGTWQYACDSGTSWTPGCAIQPLGRGSPPNARFGSWLPRRMRSPSGTLWMVWIPLWLPFVGIVVPTAYLFYRDRRHPPGHCQRCGYNLTGNESGVCPECGTEVETP